MEVVVGTIGCFAKGLTTIRKTTTPNRYEILAEQVSKKEMNPKRDFQGQLEYLRLPSKNGEMKAYFRGVRR